MKNKKQLYISLLLLQVFLMTSANAFAFTSFSKITDSSEQEEYYNPHLNKQAVLFEESITGFEAETSSENENELYSYIPEHYFKFRPDFSYSVNNHISDYQPNGKEFLKKHIFPFHFFW
ncbi:hypothetical protein [Christiangramia forsetii]|uniref:Secreted protein n=2 Tax=Christiangramia forsetii TaxID=411153 RepID=A0M6C9_CHRFK|nr:hypothetical protein [Christiangramia forsetii]CAL68174.1 secreted protein [Christiangramia forsetii KT0803]